MMPEPSTPRASIPRHVGTGARRLPPALLLLLAAAPLPLAAQDGIPWRAGYFPYFLGNPTTGPMLVLRYEYAQLADYEARVPYAGIFSAEAGASALGSRFLAARFRGPLLVDGWRFAGDLVAFRESRFGYYGLGPEAVGDPPPALAAEPYPFRARRARYWGRAEITRRLRGPLQAAAALTVDHERWSALPGQSVFRTEFGSEAQETDVKGRLSLVLDLRDHEFLTTRGLLGEAGLLVGSEGALPGATGGGGSYGGWYAHVRGYFPAREGTVVAARVAARSYPGEASLGARFELPAWERDVVAMGGAESHRSFVRGRFGGRGLLLGSLEVRHNLLDAGDYGGVTIVAFTDLGRVFESEDFTLSLSDLLVGYGGGLGFRILRQALLVLNFAGGPDGFNFSMGQGWAF
ncbi:MAG: BamA/TamA family outer membrane protein [Gemmatimonadales bacterium]